MNRFSGKQILAAGFVLVLFGMVVPWLMVLRIIQPTFLLSFVAFGASFLGLMFGLIGVSQIVQLRRHRDTRDESYREDPYRDRRQDGR
jgi:hypothetical protein